MHEELPLKFNITWKIFQNQSFMKPESDEAAIKNTVTRDPGTLTKCDVRGDTKDVSKTETLKGLGEISFVEKHSQTNILVMTLTNRYNLESQSYVNYEVKVFNRKLPYFSIDNAHPKLFRHSF
jgi:hypothetical protein